MFAARCRQVHEIDTSQQEDEGPDQAEEPNELDAAAIGYAKFEIAVEMDAVQWVGHQHFFYFRVAWPLDVSAVEGQVLYPGGSFFGGRIPGEKGIEMCAVIGPVRILIQPAYLIIFPGKEDAGMVEGAVLGQVLIYPADGKRGLVIAPNNLTYRVGMAEEGGGGALRYENSKWVFEGCGIS